MWLKERLFGNRPSRRLRLLCLSEAEAAFGVDNKEKETNNGCCSATAKQRGSAKTKRRLRSRPGMWFRLR